MEYSLIVYSREEEEKENRECLVFLAIDPFRFVVSFSADGIFI